MLRPAKTRQHIRRSSRQAVPTRRGKQYCDEHNQGGVLFCQAGTTSKSSGLYEVK